MIKMVAVYAIKPQTQEKGFLSSYGGWRLGNKGGLLSI